VNSRRAATCFHRSPRARVTCPAQDRSQRCPEPGWQDRSTVPNGTPSQLRMQQRPAMSRLRRRLRPIVFSVGTSAGPRASLVVDERARPRIRRANDDELTRSLKVAPHGLIVFRTSKVLFIPENIEPTLRHWEAARRRIAPQPAFEQHCKRLIFARVAYESIM
jgi:hypothetical protein